MSEQQEQHRETKNPAPGQYVSKLVDYAIGKTQQGKPQVLAVFDFKDSNGEQFQRVWAGSLVIGKAREITIKALRVMGLQGGEERIPLLARGVDSGELNLEKKVQITVVDEKDQNSDRVYSKIRWVNDLGGPMMASRMMPEEATELLARMAGIGGGGGFSGSSDTIPF